MHEKDDLPQDSIADGIENDDESNGQEEEELDPDQVRFLFHHGSESFMWFVFRMLKLGGYIGILQGTAFVDSKEDMFVDAPEELNFDTPSKEALTTDDDDNDDLGTHFNVCYFFYDSF